MPFSRPEGSSVRRNGLQGNNSRSSSKAYDRFFEGYTAYTAINADNKKVTHYIYTGDYVVRHISGSKGILLKLFYAALIPVGIGMMILSLQCTGGELIPRYAELPGAVCVIVLMFYLRALVNYLISGNKMTMYRYRRSGTPLKRCAYVLAGAYLAGAVLMLFSVLFSKEVSFHWRIAAASCCYLLPAVWAFLAARTEEKVVYTKEENDASVPENVPEENIYTIKNNYDEAADILYKDEQIPRRM